MRKNSRLRTLVCAAGLFAGAAGCAPPIGVKHLTPEDANHALTANVLTSEHYSAYSGRVLQRLALAEQFDEDPDAALKALHAGLGGLDEDYRLLALSELSLDHGLKSGDRAQFVAAAAYAWAFLFPEDEHEGPGLYEDRRRLAADLYNRGVALGLEDESADEHMVDVRARTITLPFGELYLDTPPDELLYAGYELYDFTSLADLEIHGLRNRYRRRGIGAPLAASVRQAEGQKASKWIGPNAKIPLTLVLRFDRPRQSLRDGQLQARAELYDSEKLETTVGGQKVPLESDSTAALAYRLNKSPVWDFELAGFRSGDFKLGGKDASTLFMLEPYQPGRIPVVFVHGTASSPARWAELSNELGSDPRIGSKYQFWFFIYNSGNPIALSSAALREALLDAVAEFDPQGRDAALRRMVLIGHSQGGLLVKMQIVDSGNAFWDSMSTVPFAEAEMSDETRRDLERILFVKPLPFVERVIFMATPHQGSYLTQNPLSRLVQRLVTMPANLVHMGQDLVRLNLSGAVKQPLRIPTSLDNMRAGNPFLVTLSSLPITDGVVAHSIVPVIGTGDPAEGEDGVVAYTSAHIDGVESELIVNCNHSVQGHPQAIEEVRRILYEHIGEDSATSLIRGGTATPVR